MQKITLTTETRRCINPNTFLGYEGENNANKLIFEFTDGFLDGLAVLKVERGETKGTIDLVKVNETYELEVKSSLLSVQGDIRFQFVITEPDGTITKYDPFVMTVKDAIDADGELPEEYPSWQEIIATELAKVEEATENANKVAEDLIEARNNGEFDGEQGERGYSPTVIEKVNTNTEYILEISYKDEMNDILTYTTPNLKAQGNSASGEIPTKLSELTNDTGFVTKTVGNLVNYYLKEETYNKEEINRLIVGLNLQIVNELPETGEQSTIYLLAQNREAPDLYDEYLWSNGWERIGSTAIDLTNYIQKTGDISDTKTTFTTNNERLELLSDEKTSVIFGKISKWLNDIKMIAFSSSYNDLTDIPVKFKGTWQSGTQYKVNDIIEHTKYYEGKAISTTIYVCIQDNVGIEPTVTSGHGNYWKNASPYPSYHYFRRGATINSYGSILFSTETPTYTSSGQIQGSTDFAYNAYKSTLKVPIIMLNEKKSVTDDYQVPHKKYVDTEISKKQDILVSGTNIKTINNKSILGEGNLDFNNSFVCTDLISQRLIIAGAYTLSDSILNYDEIIVEANLLAEGGTPGRNTTVTIIPSMLDLPTNTGRFLLHIADTKASDWNSMACEVLFGFTSETELTINRTVLGTSVADRTYGISHVYGIKF